MKHDQLVFLQAVAAFVKASPELAPYVTQAASQGISERFEEIRDLAADCETLAVLAMSRRSKNVDNAVLTKLEKLNGKSFMRWDDEIARLRGEKEKQS